jgi:hypothetical protein
VTYKSLKTLLFWKKKRRYGEESCGDYHGDGAMDGGVFVLEY